MKGQSAAAPPTAAAAPVATNKKSRRVGWSAEDAVVTIPTLSSYATGGTAPGAPKVPGTVCRRPRPPAAAELRPFTSKRVKQQSRIVLLAPLPGERKPAIGAGACHARIPGQAMFY
ncbi:hypothetical protein BwSH20_14050 [Bradyrhizobium ottawaense]|nr:hypothetical protein TM102_59360 [Bradyrhizobium sp. TM102]GMO16694.1 hypothetical protein BwSF12_02110 [Bradyrhizobium ottawaense]GMO40401.1 hypothetical protein BwSH14_51410 [Bradyrhizobium ottawaense]GMO64719.1 hypothetical protein BwSG20_23820 [Bradyrhizobium ottawaense]GMO68898.1 hypothetical protein BwSH17_23660 [Bradyrhizobium ottawaense]